MFNRLGCTVGALVAVTTALGLGLALAADPATEPAKREYGFQAGEDVVYKFSVLVEWPTEKLPLTGYSIYHIHSANSAGYIAFTHSVKLSPPAGAEQATVPDAPPVRSFFAECDVMINRCGERVARAKNEPLPYLLGEGWSLLVPWVDLIPEDSVKWDVGSGGPDFPVLDPSHPPKIINFHGTGDQPSEERTAEKSIVTRTSGFTLNDMSMSSTSRRVWDFQRGRVESFDLKGIITLPGDGRPQQVPITVSAGIASPEEAQGFLEDLHARQREDEKNGLRTPTTSRAEMPTPRDNNGRRFKHDMMELEEVSPAHLAEALLTLKKASRGFEMARACDKLATMKPLYGFRQEAIQALLPLLADRDRGVRTNAADAVGVWGSPSEIPALQAAMKGEDDFEASEYMKDAIREIKERGEISPPKPGSHEETEEQGAAQAVRRELEMQRMAEANQAALQPPPAPVPDVRIPRDLIRRDTATKRMTSAGLDATIAKLKDLRHASDAEAACRALSRTKPTADRRDEVAKALVPLLSDRDDEIRLVASDALGLWGSRDDLPAMKAALLAEKDGINQIELKTSIREITERAILERAKRASAPAPAVERPSTKPAAPAAPSASNAPPAAAQPPKKIIYER